jgi:acyl-CoA dehydrogenase family protein 10
MRKFGTSVTSAVRENHKFNEQKLFKYLAASFPDRFADMTTASTIDQFLHGQSNPTFSLRDKNNEQIVVRKQPPGHLLPGAHAVDREYTIMTTLKKYTDVPVPNAFHYCDDPSIVGTPFYIYDYVKGHFFDDPSLPEKELTPADRTALYFGLADVMADLHSVRPELAPELDSFGRSENYVSRQIKTWTRQYDATVDAGSPIKSMELLKDMLPALSPPPVENDRNSFVVHGDLRIDNCIYRNSNSNKSPLGPVAAILDWELSTLADTPLLDLAYASMVFHLPSYKQCSVQGFADLTTEQRAAIGLPSEKEFIQRYLSRAKRNDLSFASDPTATQPFYLSLSMFKIASILQGVYQRGLRGNASAPNATSLLPVVRDISKIGLKILKQYENDNIPQVGSSLLKGETKSNEKKTGIKQRLFHASATSSSAASSSSPFIDRGKELVPLTVHSHVSERAFDTIGRLDAFVNDRILPVEMEIHNHQYTSKDRWGHIHPLYEELKHAAKAENLWNLFLPKETEEAIGKSSGSFGAGFTNLEYGCMAEITGRSLVAPEIFNCSAPDTGNMETILRYGTPAQHEEWLVPLLDGDIRSCFAMTEPAVASSDATNMEATIVDQGDGTLLLNGHKWWTTGAADPRCKVAIFMGIHVSDEIDLEDPSTRHSRHSMVLVPMEQVNIVRPLTVYGYDDAPHGHCETVFKDVIVPKENVLLGPGRGFEIAQGRLGPGRIHHCMRQIGAADRAINMMCHRVTSRVAFGKYLSEQGTIVDDVARCAIEVEQTRLLCLHAAHMMDIKGNIEAKNLIAMIKIAAPSMAKRVLDISMQSHGAVGLSNDLPLAHMYAWARILQQADGPDQVHIAALGKAEIKKRAGRYPKRSGL